MEHKNTYRACVPASPPIPIHGSNNTDGKSTPHRHHHHPPHTINNTSATTNPISCCEELRDGAPTSSEGGSLRRAPRQSSCASMIEESSSGSVFITHQTSRTMSYLTPRGDDDDDEDDEEENLSYVDGMMSTVIRPHRLVLLTPANSSNKLCIQHNHANTHTPHQHHHHHRWKEEGGSSTTENTPTQQRLGKGPQSALHLQQLHHIVDDNADDDDVSKHRRRGSDPSPTNSATHAHHPPITSLEEKRHVSVASRHIPRRSPPPTWVPRSAPTTFATLSSRTPRSKCRDDDDDHDGASNNNKKKSMVHEEEGEEEMSVLVLPLPTTAMTEVEVCACRARAAARQHLRSSTPILCECNSPVCSAKTMAVAAPRTASRVVIREKKKDEGVEDHQPVLHVAEQHALHLHNDDDNDSHTPPQQLDHHHQQPYRPLLLRHPISILSLEVEDDALAMTANTTNNNNNNKNNNNNNSDAVMRKELLDGHDVLHTPFSLSEETIDAVLSRPTTSSSQQQQHQHQQQQQHQRDSYSHRHSSPPTYHTRPSFVDLSSHAVGHLPLSSTRRNHRWRSTSVSHSNNNRSQKQQQPSQHNNNNNNGESSCAPRSRSDNNARRGSSPPTSVSEATMMMMNMDTPSSSQRQEHHQHNNMDYFDDSTSPPLPASAMSDGEHNNKMLSSTPWMPSFVSISHLEVLQAAAVPPSSTSFSSTKDEMKEKRASLREGCAQHGFACFGQDSMVASSHSLGGVHQQQQQQQQQHVVDGSSNCSRRGACIPRLPAPASLFSLNSMLHSHPDGGGSDFFLDQGSGI